MGFCEGGFPPGTSVPLGWAWPWAIQRTARLLQKHPPRAEPWDICQRGTARRFTVSGAVGGASEPLSPAQPLAPQLGIGSGSRGAGELLRQLGMPDRLGCGPWGAQCGRAWLIWTHHSAGSGQSVCLPGGVRGCCSSVGLTNRQVLLPR